MVYPLEPDFRPPGHPSVQPIVNVASLVHAADGPMKTLCGFSLDDHMPPAQRLVRFYTDHPSFDVLWAHQQMCCPGCANEINRRNDEKIKRQHEDAAVRERAMLSRAIQVPVWVLLYTIAVAAADGLEERQCNYDDFYRYVKRVRERLYADLITTSERRLLGNLEPYVTQITEEVVQAEHVRQGQALSAEWDKIVAEYPEATRALVWEGFKRATLNCIGHVPGQDEGRG